MQDKYKENKPKNITVKLLKPKCKQQIFKASKRKRYIVYNIERDNVVNDTCLLTRKVEARRQENDQKINK